MHAITEIFRVFSPPLGFVHKTSPSYVGTNFSCSSLFGRFLEMLSPRQIAIAAEYLDGRTQAEIASEQGIDQATVSRDLQHVRKTCERFGRTLPKPQRVHARKEQQLTDGIYHLI